MLVRVTWLHYTYDGPNEELLLKVAGRTENGERKTFTVTGCSPYIFVPLREPIPDQILDKITDVVTGYTSYDGKKLKALHLIHPQKKLVDEVKSHFSITYESDIPFYRRMALDGISGHISIPNRGSRFHINDINTEVEVETPIKPRVIISDIEITENRSVPFEVMAEEAKQPIIAVTLWDSYEDDYHAIILDENGDFNSAKVNQLLHFHWDEHEEKGEYLKNIYVETAPTEIDLINRFIDIINQKRPDVIAGWNWVNFDHSYILDRIEVIKNHHSDQINAHRLSDLDGLQYSYYPEQRITGLPGFDMMDAFMDMQKSQWRSKALDYVSGELLGLGKVDGININDCYENNPEKLLAYNIIDVQLCVAIDRQQNVMDFFYELADLCSIPVYDTMSPMRRVDGYIISRREDDEVLPATEEKELKRNAGALVKNPPTGIMDWIGVHDLKSLYPSVIITFNISPETIEEDTDKADLIVPYIPSPDDLDGREIVPEDLRWEGEGVIGTSLEKEGILPKYLKGLFPEREEKKRLMYEAETGSVQEKVLDLQQYALKVLMNTVYGVTSHKHWRLSAPNLGDMITGGGRYIIWKSFEISEEIGYPVIYSDTDSVFIPLLQEGEEFESLEKVLETGEYIHEELNARVDSLADEIGVGDVHPYLVDGSLKHGTDRHCISFEFEKVYKRYLQGGKKKRYAGHIVWKEGKEVDDIQITGFESNRSDSTESGALCQTKTLDIILSGGGFDDVSEFVRAEIEEMKTSFNTKKHGLPKPYNPPYEPNLPIVRGVKYANEHMGYNWKGGDKTRLVYVRQVKPGLPPTDVIAIDWKDDVPEGFMIHQEEMIEKGFRNPLKSILEVAGWSFSEIRTGHQTQGLQSDTNVSGNPFEHESERPNPLLDW